MWTGSGCLTVCLVFRINTSKPTKNKVDEVSMFGCAGQCSSMTGSGEWVLRITTRCHCLFEKISKYYHPKNTFCTMSFFLGKCTLAAARKMCQEFSSMCPSPLQILFFPCEVPCRLVQWDELQEYIDQPQDAWRSHAWCCDGSTQQSNQRKALPPLSVVTSQQPALHRVKTDASQLCFQSRM